MKPVCSRSNDRLAIGCGVLDLSAGCARLGMTIARELARCVGSGRASACRRRAGEGASRRAGDGYGLKVTPLLS